MHCYRTVLALALAAVSAAQDPSGGIAWGHEKLKGVNLGGWLVTEYWITPSLFDRFPNSGIVDEYTLGEKLGHDQALAVLKPHWDSFYKLEDFQKIADSGLTHGRLPVGFWAYDNANTPFVSGAAPYVDQAIAWARQVGIKLIIDLHGAPGSQNGFDNSGQRLDNGPQWQKGDNVARTLRVLKIIQSKYGAKEYDDVIAGIELLNEPLTPSLDLNAVQQFYRDGYAQQRQVSSSRVVILHDGFQKVSSWNGILTPQDHNAQNVAMDHHEYQVFDNALVALQPWQHRQLVCNNKDQWANGDKWTFIGEWTGAMTDCAKGLNGYGRGARYDGTLPGSHYVGSCDKPNNFGAWDQAFKDDMRAYIEAQMDTFESSAQGWTFWNAKTENSSAPEWDAFFLIDQGIFPQPLDARKFPPACS